MQRVLLLLKKLFSARGLVAVFGLLIIGMVLLIIFVPEEQTPPAGEINQPQLTEEVKTKLTTLSQDSDSDGLKDWEEPLYRTDANNPDTDGDGTNDGNEIQQNRDPLKKGPNDKTAEPQSGVATENEGVNLTAELMSTLIQGGVLEYLAQGGDPEALPGEFYARLEAVASQSLDLKIPTVSLSELRIISDSSTQAIKNYFNALAGVYEKYIFTLQKDDLQLFQEILDSENITRFNELNIYIEAADKSVAELKKIPVPQIRAEFHKKEVEFFLRSKAEVAILKNTDNDPLATLLILPQRIATKKALHDFHVTEMKEWLEARAITFGANEKAVLLLRAY
ncbi:MAG: hypothetical protein Q7R73_04255 [bacterium]|nr:hypothetical protein [bacterium]